MTSLLALAGIGAVFAASSGAQASHPGTPAPQSPVVSAREGETHPNRLVVRFRDGVAPGQARQAIRDLGASIKKEHGRSKLWVIELSEGADTSAAIGALHATGVVEFAGEDYVVAAFDIPDDPDYDLQWHLRDTNGGMWAQGAWDLAPSAGAGVTVAVIDTGVAYETHTGAPILWTPRSFAPAPDLAGVSIVAPWNFLEESSHANDDHGHGTHVSGTILQATGNGYGGAGVAHGANLMPIKILDFSGNGSAADLIESIYYAVDNGADVINMSLGFGGSGSPDAYGEVCSEIVGLKDALDYAFEEGVTVVAAAGNEGASVVACPAAYHTVVAVGATRFDGQVTFYSNTGYNIDITAPGGDPNVDQDGNGQPDGVFQETFCLDSFTMLVTGDYSQFCTVPMPGTSMASPHVAGTAALLLGEHPSLTPMQVRHYLQTTARDRGAAGFDHTYGWGALDAHAAVAALQAGTPPDIPPAPPPPPPPSGGPAAPTALTASATSTSSIVLTWEDNAPNETGYKVERRDTAGNFFQLALLGPDTTTYTSTNLASGVEYFFRVRAAGSTADSYYSNVASATTFPPPPPPSGVTATALSPSTIRVDWVDNSSNETAFRVERSTNGTQWLFVANTPANVTTSTSLYLTPNTTYYFRVRATQDANFSAWSATASATTFPPPAAPTNVVATATGSSSITVSWTDNSSSETNFRVERSMNGSAFSQVAQVGANVTSWTNLNLTPGTTYSYRVRAVEGSAVSDPSAVSSATTLGAPAAPTNLVATPVSLTSINLTWTDNSTGESGFRIERSSDGVTFLQVGSVGANVTSFTNNFLTGGASYWYRVRAYEGGLNGPWSEVVVGSTMPPPAAPTNATAAALSNASIRVDWTDNATSETGYKVERSLDGVAWTQVMTLPANATTWTNVNLTAGTTYHYRVRANEGTVNGAFSNVATATTFPPPATPTGVTATALSTSSIRVDWTDNSSSEQGFRIERSTDGGATWTQVVQLGPNVTTWTNIFLAPGTTYHYRIRAYEGAANGAYSAATSATTFPPPAAPTNLVAVMVNATTIQLSWTDNAANEAGFKLERSTNGGASWLPVATVGPNVTTWTQLWATPGTTYLYRVRAYEGSTNSDWSNTVTITP
jgi:subtilisin family serine protease